MPLTRFQKLTLAIAGLTALAIGAFILLAPQTFYAGYGIALAPGPDMLSEVRAPGAGLAAFGGVMLAGLVRSDWAAAAKVAALTVFLAFPLGRFVGLALDGLPSGAILGALAIEVAIAGLCLLAFARSAPGPAARMAG